MIEGTDTIVGPTTNEEKAEHNWFIERHEMFEDELQNPRAQRAVSRQGMRKRLPEPAINSGPFSRATVNAFPPLARSAELFHRQ